MRDQGCHQTPATPWGSTVPRAPPSSACESRLLDGGEVGLLFIPRVGATESLKWTTSTRSHGQQPSVILEAWGPGTTAPLPKPQAPQGIRAQAPPLPRRHAPCCSFFVPWFSHLCDGDSGTPPCRRVQERSRWQLRQRRPLCPRREPPTSHLARERMGVRQVLPAQVPPSFH